MQMSKLVHDGENDEKNSGLLTLFFIRLVVISFDFNY